MTYKNSTMRRQFLQCFYEWKRAEWTNNVNDREKERVWTYKVCAQTDRKLNKKLNFNQHVEWDHTKVQVHHCKTCKKKHFVIENHWEAKYKWTIRQGVPGEETVVTIPNQNSISISISISISLDNLSHNNNISCTSQLYVRVKLRKGLKKHVYLSTFCG